MTVRVIKKVCRLLWDNADRAFGMVDLRGAKWGTGCRDIFISVSFSWFFMAILFGQPAVAVFMRLHKCLRICVLPECLLIGQVKQRVTAVSGSATSESHCNLHKVQCFA